MNVADLYRSPNALAPSYSRFRVDERLLLTGHSHQAWPDVGFAAQQQAWLDAAEFVDLKWERAFDRAERVRRGWSNLLGDSSGGIALGASTHDLVVRLLSALPLQRRPRIVTTDGEFHTLRRQLARLSEAGIEVVRVAADPAESVAERLIAALDERTALVAVSSVFFQTAQIAAHLGAVQEACSAAGATMLVDAYHSLGVVPLSLGKDGLDDAFVVGGGYKYCQLGEGNCFLRVPPRCEMRPVVTGWFAEFDLLAGEHDAEVEVRYGDGAVRFAGSTYDPTSHYRACAVFDFFEEHELTAEFLRQVSQHQIGHLATGFDALDLDPAVVARDRDVAVERIAGFMVLRAPQAGDLSRRLGERGVYTDARGETLRFGPAPYLSDAQLDEALAILGEVVGGFD